ncbi:MAG: hypothetical protein PHT69_12860 [Bacteroidales bacterium]|nr:hypothetical protein [Bacteroidales bacterium]
MMLKRIHIIKIIVVLGAIIFALFLSDLLLVNEEQMVLEKKFRAFNDSINETNHVFARQNPHGFTDIKRSKDKPDSTFRIAVMGDSFIYGDGISYSETWSHKLAAKMDSAFQNVELFSWGLRGWSTLDQYNFFVSEGNEYAIDLLLFAFCHNDPDMGDIEHLDTRWEKKLHVLNKLFPRLTTKVLSYFFADSYDKWVNALYEKDNLEKYKKLLNKIKLLEHNYNLKTAFLLTPNTLNGNGDFFFSTISSLLEEAGIPFYNLQPEMKEAFQNVNDKDLWANPVNPHPGKWLNDFYAEKALQMIFDKNLLDSSLVKFRRYE